MRTALVTTTFARRGDPRRPGTRWRRVSSALRAHLARGGIAVVVAFVLLALLNAAAYAAEPQAVFRLDGGRPHVDLPFQLELHVEGFDEAPAPEQPALLIDGATVTPLGATPSVSRSIQIFNGRRRDVTHVTWVLRWRVEVHEAGRIRVPATTVAQGAKSATAKPGDVEVDAVPTADDMALELGLPSRPVFVGETIPVTLAWRFRRQPEEQQFSVPLMSSDAFTVSAPPVDDPRRALTFPAGAKELQVPFKMDRVTVGGVVFDRLTATFHAAPRRAGRVEVAPSSVVAALAVGRPDFFGNAPTRLFRASDVARVLEVKALPETGRPPTFSGAVGDQFSIAVRTSRSVVQLGEPVELEVVIRSNQPLDTLSLGRLEGEGRLPRDKFVVPADPPTGELTDEGRTKTFRLTAQVAGPATEVPAIAFSYFDATKGVYQTIRSDPIALSVKGGAFVGAADVVAATPPAATPRAKGGGSALSDDAALVSADLALSGEGATGDAPLSGAPLWTLVLFLHAVPIAVLVTVTWRARTRGVREERAEVRAARRRAEDLLAAAAAQPARDVAGPLVSALRDLARLTGHAEDDAGLLSRIETECFAPDAAAMPLSEELRGDAESLLRQWSRASEGRRPQTAAAVAGLLLALAAGTAVASPLSDARAAYQEAMGLTSDATARRAAFARAAIAFGEAARETARSPELLTDWGNAALGSGEVATATLAYRRALALDGSNARARHNLAWLRSRQPDAFRPPSASAADTLLFFHAWPQSRRLLGGSAAFAVAILLLVPWAGRRRRGLLVPALVPATMWIAMVGSVVLEDRRDDDAVVMDDAVLRAADSPGAPAVLSQSLPRGSEITILERRDAWTHVRLANGASGWLPGGAVEPIGR